MHTSGSSDVRKRLVLLGGGHSHLSVLMAFAKKPQPGLELCLISHDIETPYSGALPAYLAGTAPEDALFLDLRPLAQMAGARLIQAEVSAVDLSARRLECPGRPPLHFDMLSLNLGSRPDIQDIPGAQALALPVKPIAPFLRHWERAQEDAAQALAAGLPYTLALVGGGPASVELACALQQRLRNALGPQALAGLHVHLFTRAPALLAAQGVRASALATQAMQERGITVHLHSRVTALTRDNLHFVCGPVHQEETLSVNACVIATGASAPAWLRDTGLALDAQGFICVNDCLQSLSHPFVFAAGDIASIAGAPRPKSGVYAVRQGMPLARNLRRYALGEPLRSHSPQQKALALLSMSDGTAIASRGKWAARGAWAHRWKTWIDERFVHRFQRLPDPGSAGDTDAIATPETPLPRAQAPAIRCAGCAAKLESNLLTRVLPTLQVCRQPDVDSSLDTVEDAALIRVDAQRMLLQTVDHFHAFLSDPYLFARIATNHCLSDIHAMGATAHSALAIVGVPHAAPHLMEDTLRELMTGCTEVLNAHNTALIGGHSAESAQLSFGLSVNGFAQADAILRKSGAQPGDVLILTKALGTGVLFAADMRYRARHRWIAPALEQMQRSNQLAGLLFLQHGAHACTDVTGFGLLGHLQEMLADSALEARLMLDALPALDGALACFDAGIRSSLHAGNQRHAHGLSNPDAFSRHRHFPLLFDPQTAGGLLAAVPADKAQACLDALHAQGNGSARCIGELQTTSGMSTVTLSEQVAAAPT